MEHSRRKKAPSFKDHLRPDDFYEPEMAPRLKARGDSQFNLPEKVRLKNGDAQMGFVPHILGGKQELRAYHDAKSRQYSVINLNDYPELDRDLGADIFEERKAELDGCRPLFVGGQVCMQVANEVYDEEQQDIEELRRMAQQSVEQYRDWAAERHLNQGNANTAFW